MNAHTFKELLLPHSRKMYAMAMTFLKNDDDARDVVQDTLAKLWEKRNELDNIQNTEAYCITMTKNICIDRLRRTQHSGYNIDIQYETLHLASDETITQIETRDRLNNVTQLMALLPAQQQKILQLRAMGDCSVEEIEQITGLSSVNIRTLLSRARRKLKELILLNQ